MLKNVPIASQQTLTIAVRKRNIVVECNCEEIKITRPTKDGNFVTIANEFNFPKMQ